MSYFVIILAIILSALDAHAVTRYMGTTGSDSNTCAQSQSSLTPKLTFSSAKGCMSAGDELGILSGTYTGTSNQINMLSMTGTSSSRYRIYAVNGAGTVVFNPPTSSDGTACRSIVTSSTSKYITLEDLVFDRSTCASFVTGDQYVNTVGITLKNVEIKNGYYHGFYLAGGSDFTMDGGSIHDALSTCVPGTRSLGLYIHNWTSNITIKNVHIYNMPGGGVQVYPGPGAGITFDRNQINSNGSCTTTDIGGMLFGATSGNMTGVVITRNLIYNNGEGGTGGNGGGIRHYGETVYTITGTTFYNNVVYNNQANSGAARGILNNTGSVNSIIKNNLVLANETAQILDLGTGTTTATNKTTGTITDCTPSTSSFVQKASSSCIDAGSDVGLPYNGSAPDIGAFESFVFASCEVPNSAASTIQITFTNNVSPPLGSTLTTFTARRNGSNNALTGAASRIGDNIVSLPLTTTYVGGDTADISWASGGLTDQSLIGGTLNQPFVQTLSNQSCTNNSGSAPSFTLTQATYKFHSVYGLESSPEVLSSEGISSFNVITGGAVRLRYSITCGGADCPSTGFYLRYSNGGAYAVIPSTFDSGNVAFCGSTYSDTTIPVNGVATTNQLSTAGTFVPGAVVFSSNAIPTVNGLNNGYKTEIEYCIKFDSDATGTYTFRIYQQDGTALNTYTATPTVVVVSGQAMGGF